MAWGTKKVTLIYIYRQMIGEGNGIPLQLSCLENPMDGGAWEAAVHGVAKSWTRVSDFIFTFHFHALEKEMATHSSVLSWRIPGMGEPGGLLSMGSHSRTQLEWLSSSSSSRQMIGIFGCGRLRLQWVLTPSKILHFQVYGRGFGQTKGFPGGREVKKSTCQCSRCGFNPWVRKISW